MKFAATDLVDDGSVLVIKMGYDDVRYFANADVALLYMRGVLLSRKEGGKHTSVETWIIDRFEYQWDQMNDFEKSVYPSLDYYRNGVKKQKFHLDMDKEYIREKEVKGNGWYPFETFLKERDLYDRYMKFPEIVLNEARSLVDLGGTNLEFGKSLDKKEE